MSNKFYSPTTQAFYAPEFREDYDAAGTWPVDAYEVTPEEEEAIRAAFVQPVSPRTWVEQQADAKMGLVRSDMTALRCLKAGQAFPPAWQTYCDSLRAIVRAPNGDPTTPLPPQPPYPIGT